MANTENKIRVLLVEDHLVTIDGLKVSLGTDTGINVVAAATTMKQGLSHIKAYHPDVVLLDLHLPDSDGPSELIKSFVDAGAKRIIVFSSETRMPVVRAVLEMGVAAYIMKSEPTARVVEIINEVMAGATGIVSPKPQASSIGTLTPAEREILSYLARGLKSTEIAEKRDVAPSTVRKQIEILIFKLGLNNREELIAWAVQNGYAHALKE